MHIRAIRRPFRHTSESLGRIGRTGQHGPTQPHPLARLALAAAVAIAATAASPAPADRPDRTDRRPSDRDSDRRTSDQNPAEKEPLPPAITEVYFNVVKGDEGDASADGSRHATGDEFVELWNPNTTPLDLTGWSLVSRLAYHAEDENARKGVRFTFPDFELGPGRVAVVFNGEATRVPGPIGSPNRANKHANERFADAHVFVMAMGSKNRSFANGGDFVLLLDPDGQPVEGVVWGDPEPAPPPTHSETDDGESVELYRLHFANKNPRGSAHRVIDDKGRFRPFSDHPDFDDSLFSPGRVLEDMDRPGYVAPESDEHTDASPDATPDADANPDAEPSR